MGGQGMGRDGTGQEVGTQAVLAAECPVQPHPLATPLGSTQLPVLLRALSHPTCFFQTFPFRQAAPCEEETHFDSGFPTSSNRK